jgi:hypothetical protein
MTLAEIEGAVTVALDEGHEPTLEAYAEYVAADMNPLIEALCLAVIECSRNEWQQVIAACLKAGAPDLGEALAKIERHIEAQRKPFVSSKAQKIDDDCEYNALLLADLNRELNQGRD